jgi:hypothetical protein
LEGLPRAAAVRAEVVQAEAARAAAEVHNWRLKNALAAFASSKIEVLRVSSMAADVDDVGETMVISTRVDAAKARVVTALGSTPDAAATEVEMAVSLTGV